MRSKVFFAILGATLVACILLADAVVQGRSFTGKVSARLLSQDKQGHWQTIDTIEWPNVTFPTSVRTLASGKIVTTDFVCRGRSAGGHDAVIRLVKPAEANVDLANGLLQLKIQLDITVDGQKNWLPADLTTESIQTPIGGFNGKRISRVAEGTGTAALVGLGSIDLRGFAGNTENKPGTYKVLIQGEGTITSANQP